MSKQWDWENAEYTERLTTEGAKVWEGVLETQKLTSRMSGCP